MSTDEYVPCSIEGCERPLKSRGWCGAHYQRWFRYGDPEGNGNIRPRDPAAACSVSECDSPVETSGICNMHRIRAKRHGDPEVRLTAETPEDAFRMYVKREGDCHVWTGTRYVSGYGRVKWQGKPIRAHRYAYERDHGPIPDGLVVRHKCDNPPCVNPEHLEIGTYQDNVNDMIARGRAHWQKAG